MREKGYWIVGLVVLGLVLFTQTTLGQAEDLKVPFSAIKSSCYGEIDMSKSELPLSEVGEECVTEDWLEENLPSESKEGEEVSQEEKKYKTEEEGETRIAVPQTAIRIGKLGEANKLAEEQNREDNKVKVPISWIKSEWLSENTEIESPATLAHKDPSLEEVVKTINTPTELVTFMKNYFKYEFREGTMTAYSPEEFMKVKRGDCKDWAVFAEYILKENDYKAKRLAYAPEPHEGWHTITLYWLEDEIYYLTTHRNSIKRYGPFNKKEEALDNEGKRRTDFSGRPEVYTFCEPDRLECPVIDD